MPEGYSLDSSDGVREPHASTDKVPWRVNECARWTRINWSELADYRELLYFLTWKEVKVRYKQTALGVVWAVLQPVMTMVVFSIFFGRLAGLGHKTGSIPYPIYVYAGLLPWSFFAAGVAGSSTSLVGNTNLITKVYFPRLIIPLSAILACIADLAVSFCVFLAMMTYYHSPITLHILAMPLCLAGVIVATTGVGLIFAALTVAYRDIKYVVPFVLQIWMFASPVIYPSSIVPHRWSWLLDLNPITGWLNGFRASFLNSTFDGNEFCTAFVVSMLLFLGGVAYFRSVERRFADII